MIQVTINGHLYSFSSDITILDACRQKNIYIPTLCFHEDLPASGKCGLCAVRINGTTFTHACIQKISNGMIIDTNSPDVIAHARRAYNNFIDMSVPPPSKDIDEISRYLFPKNTIRTRESDQSNSIDFDPSKCINCGRCVRMCSDVQNVNALNYQNPRIRNNECISCGQCITVCPTDALTHRNSKPEILSAIADKKILVIQMAPATRVAIGEGFGYEPGTVVTGKIIEAARRMGFKYVFDTNFGADMTVIEEGNELLRRLNIKVDPSFNNTEENTNILSLYNDLNKSGSNSKYSLNQEMNKRQISQSKSVCSKTLNQQKQAVGQMSPNNFNLRPQISSSMSNYSNVAPQIRRRFSLNAQKGKIGATLYQAAPLNPLPEPEQVQLPNNSTTRTTSLSDISFNPNNQNEKQIQESNALPQFTSCCPSWVNYVEKLHHELIPNLSSTKSPHMILAKLVKTYFASLINVDAKDIFMVSLMPCVAKKDEIRRMQLNGDVDAVITSKEFISLVEDFGIDFKTLKESTFDNLLGNSSGGGQMFGTTGGVAEASVRYIHKLITREPMSGKIEYEEFRGMKSIKTASIKIDQYKINIAVCNGISAVNELIECEKYKQFDFIEVMACPGGCIGGAGQPYLKKSLMHDRMKSIFNIDRQKKIRIADENNEIIQVYKNFVGPVGGPNSHYLFHTHYEPQESAILAQRRRMLSKPIVAYGSASGTAMKFARVVANFIETTSVAINSLTIKQLISRKVALFVISTIGEGEYPTNAKKFIKELSESMDELSEVKYAVCALGNRSYNYFCKAGVQLDSFLEQHLARQILPLVKIDTSTEDKGETEFEGWCHNLSRALGLKPPKIEVHLNYSLQRIDDETILSNPLKPVGFESASLKSSKMISSEELKGTNHQMTMYQIKLPQGCSYSTGDLIEILPENPPELVDKVIDVLKLNANQVYTLISNDTTIETFVPEKVSVKQIFSQYLDLTGPPNRAILRAFLTVANKEGTDRIDKMLDVKQEEEVKQYLKDINTCEFICEFAQYGIPSIELILSGCHHTQPRQYFIASSPMRSRNVANILVLKHKFGINCKRNGMCTSFLERPKLKTILMKINKSSFEMPEDCKAPVIMVAIGCGIAPMLSIIQNRGPQNGPSCLIFGSTSSQVYTKITDELDKEKENGSVTDILYAWSNENIIGSEVVNNGSSTEIEDGTGEKIKEVFLANKELIWKYWFDDRTSLYYCGIPGHLPDEIKELLLKITIEEGGLSMEEAMAINNRHQVFIEAF